MLQTKLTQLNTRFCLGLGYIDRRLKAATVVISEYNGGSAGSGVKTSNITNSNMGSVDSASLDPVANFLTATSNSYEKNQVFEVTSMGTSSSIQNFKVWDSAAPATGGTMKTNLQTATPPATAVGSYTVPVNTATAVSQTMPTSTPGTNNLAGSLTATGVSNLIITQLQLSGATAGTTLTRNYQYDEVA